MSIKKNLAELISGVLHPIAVPIAAYWFLLEMQFPENTHRYLYLGIIFLIYTLVPTFMVMFLKKTGRVSDYDISKRSQRVIPLSIAIAAYFIGFIIMKMLQAPHIISGLFLFYALNTVFLMFITLKWKISVHLSSYTAPIAVLYVVFGPWALFLLLLTPLLMWSRIHLKAHTFMQTLAGSVMGFGLLYAEAKIWLNM
jgi:membrane-associated phospholipid phosphatase